MNRQAPADHCSANVTGDDLQPTAGAPTPRTVRAPVRLTSGVTAAGAIAAVGSTGWHMSANLPVCLVAAATGAAIATGVGTLPRLYWISLYAKLVRAGVRHAQNVDDVRSLIDGLNDAPAGQQK
jgi:hypothetical protein